MKIRWIIKNFSIALLIYLVVAMLFLLFYDAYKPNEDQKLLNIMYFTNNNLLIIYLSWIIKGFAQNKYVNKLFVIVLVFKLFSLFHDIYYVIFDGWSKWIDVGAYLITSLLILKLLAWLRTTG